MTDSQKNPDGGNCDMDFRRVYASELARIAARARKAEDKRERDELENARWEDGLIRRPKH